MALRTETSDHGILDLLGRGGSLRISDLVRATRVTPTAVRQRLSRLMRQGLIDRATARTGRGRPSHTYSLTESGRRAAGHNFVDLALVLWQEVRGIRDLEVRRGLLQRIAKQMASLYAGRVGGTTVGERMQSVAEIFTQRGVPFVIEKTDELGTADGQETAGPQDASPAAATPATGQLPVLTAPVLTALACPYPQLAEQDRGICALERLMIAELLEHDVKLSACRLDGDSCCRFQTN